MIRDLYCSNIKYIAAILKGSLFIIIEIEEGRTKKNYLCHYKVMSKNERKEEREKSLYRY